MDLIEKIANDIRELRIQGARKIAKAALYAIEIQLRRSKANDSDALYSELVSVADYLASQRPTEPMLRNTLRYIITQFDPELSVKEQKKSLLKAINGYFKKIDGDAEKIAHFGAQQLPEGALVLTHCHSNTIMKIFKKAYDIGKKFRVICTETRPIGQGFLTAEELSNYGIEVTMIVDSAVSSYIKKVDLTFVGADAITATGDLINKIGTRTVAEICNRNGISFLCAAELYKYDPLTQWGNNEIIEFRSPKEIIGERKVKFNVENPAFDVTPASLISAYITEKGVLPPAMLMLAAKTDIIKTPF